MACGNKPSRMINKVSDAIAQSRRGRRNLSGHGNISSRKVVGAHAGTRSVGTDAGINKKLAANMSPRETNRPGQIVAAGLTK